MLKSLFDSLNPLRRSSACVCFQKFGKKVRYKIELIALHWIEKRVHSMSASIEITHTHSHSHGVQLQLQQCV